MLPIVSGRLLSPSNRSGDIFNRFARRGYRVTAVDKHAMFLDHAKTTADGTAIEWVQEDMRLFVRPNAFDVAVNMYTAFGYFEDAAENAQVLRHVAQSLKPGGAFAIEVKSKEALARDFRARDWRSRNGITIVEERVIENDWSWCRNRWIILEDDRRYVREFGHWLYSAAELKAMCSEAGFSSAHAFGGVDGRPYDDRASRLLVVARK